MISTFAFRVRNVPAALYKAMGGFATNGVNMTKLESHLGGTFFVTQFYADVDGHPKDTALTLASRSSLMLGMWFLRYPKSHLTDAGRLRPYRNIWPISPIALSGWVVPDSLVVELCCHEAGANG